MITIIAFARLPLLQGLPVELLSFTGANEGNYNVLLWQTASK